MRKHFINNKGRISLSALLVVSILVGTGVFYLSGRNTADAAAITSASDTLSNSAPNATSNHTIVFTTPTGIAASATMTVTFDSSFATGSVDYTDIDLADDGGDVTLADTPSGSDWGATTTASGILFTNGSSAVAADSEITIKIGDNATTGTTGDAWITNPAKSAAMGTADVYTVSIGGGFGDSGDMLIAIIEGVTVSVTIDESLSFSIAPETNANCDTVFGAEAGPDTTTTTVPFGAVSSANTFNHACQNLAISTNASSGYAVTVETDTSLKTGAGVLINSGTCDGTCSETATDTWATATNNGFAYSCDGSDCSITSNSDYKAFACMGATTTDCLPGGGETAQTFMSNSGVVNNSTSSIEYRISISGTQEAGTYSNTVTYIATPTF